MNLYIVKIKPPVAAEFTCHVVAQGAISAVAAALAKYEEIGHRRHVDDSDVTSVAQVSTEALVVTASPA